jgi:C1A family cysteine protease
LIDLRPSCPPVYDQGERGSCTANALNAAYQFEEMKQGKENFIPSRLFVYYNERAMEGTIYEDAGAIIRDGIKTLVKDGVCPETMWEYIPSRFSIKPPQECYDAALNNQVLSYYSVNKTIRDVKQCLAEGYPVVFGFTVFDSFMSQKVARTGIAEMPKRNEQPQGGHAIMAVGYDDSKEALIIRNSWGTNWGLNGYFYMPYGYITNNLATDFWTIRLVE